MYYVGTTKQGLKSVNTGSISNFNVKSLVVRDFSSHNYSLREQHYMDIMRRHLGVAITRTQSSSKEKHIGKIFSTHPYSKGNDLGDFICLFFVL